MTKTTKIQLLSMNDNVLSFPEFNKIMWTLQDETRAVANRCIQLCWEYFNFESDWYKANNSYPSSEVAKNVVGQSLSGYAYNKCREIAPTLCSMSLSSTTQMACGKFKSSKKDIIKGEMSIPSYKKNMPIELHKKAMAFDYETDENNGVKNWYVSITLLSTEARKSIGLSDGRLRFKCVVPAKCAGSVRAILERCYDGVYEICGSKIKYENGKWFLMLCYSFDNGQIDNGLSADNIMGVHIGEHNAVVCAFNNTKRQYVIEGGEVLAFAVQIERRKAEIGRATSKNSSLCGGSRIGHGYKKKLRPLTDIGNKIANFRNTTNHRYAKQIVDWAVKNKCGTIQLEDLTGLASEDVERYAVLRNWSYYDLMTKIEYKAKAFGIKVIKVEYKNLHKWCTTCQAPSIETDKNNISNVYGVCPVCSEVFEQDVNIPNALIVDKIDEILKNNNKAKKSKTKEKKKKN